ncbi:MAG: HipA domain-containing protein [Synergistaceae bacterium]|nr:HipA domain-containing protein [Synergistaceae bacterium]
MDDGKNADKKHDILFYGEQEIGYIDSEGRIKNFTDGDGIKLTTGADVFLRNALPEGERYENMLLHSPHPIETTADALRNLDEIPGRFSINKPERRICVPLPYVTEDIVFAENNLSPDMFFVNSEIRVSQKPSFSGYQDKFTAKAYLRDGKLSVGPVDPAEEFGNVIVKPGIKLSFVAENEFTCMRLAGKVGLDVPRTYLLRHPDGKLSARHLCVERFDFRKIPHPGKRDVMEFASFMGLDSKNKYSAQTEELFETAEKILDKANMIKLASAYFYGILTGNGDMHTKNFSVFVEKGGDYCLTPIYDMVNTEVHGFPDMLALPMNESCNPNPSMRGIAAFLKRYIDSEEMFQMAQDVRRNLPDVLNLAFPEDGDGPEFIDRSRVKFRRSLEKSILSRVADVEKVRAGLDGPSYRK